MNVDKDADFKVKSDLPKYLNKKGLKSAKSSPEQKGEPATESKAVPKKQKSDLVREKVW